MGLFRIVSRRILNALLAAALLLLVPLEALPFSGRARQQGGVQPVPVGKRIWLGDAQAIKVKHVGSATSVQAIASAQPLAMAAGDFDADGVDDVVIGYASANGGILALHRGNLDAFAPQSEASFQAIAHGEFPSPFIPTARLFELPVRPDFVQVGSFSGNGYPDVVVAQRGDSSVYLLANDGKGGFAKPKVISVGAPIDALAAGDFGSPGIYSRLLVGIGDASGSYLMVCAGSPNGVGALKVLRLHASASNIVFGDFGGGSDAVFISGGHVVILHASSMRLEPLSLPVAARSLALGSFIWDRNPQRQIAILSADGSVHIATHSEFDPRAYTAEELQLMRYAARGRQNHPVANPRIDPAYGWKIVESFSDVASSGNAVLLRTRISDHGADDVMVLDSSRQQLTVIAHPDLAPGDINFTPGEISSRPYNGSPIAAIAMRTNVDGRPGIIAIHQREVAPAVMMPLPDPTFTVDDSTDELVANACSTPIAGKCSLREALVEANAAPGTDTIMVPAGTWALTIGRSVPAPGIPPEDAKTGTLNVNDSVNIIGAGQNSTVITWGTPSSGTVDMVMSVNEDIQQITNASASISNLTIQNGVNHGSNSEDGDGGCMEFDTGGNGTATLTLTNVTLQNCSTLQGGGGGLVIFNFVTPAGGGGATISNSIIQGNSVADSPGVQAGNGGGIAIAQDGHMTMTASQVLNNSAVQNCTPSCGLGDGGGIIAFAPQNVSATTAETFIHSSTISGNKSAGFGGGIWSGTALSIDTGTVISGNVAGSNGTSDTANANQEGGGLYSNPLSCPLSSTCTTTLNKVTITGNKTTGNGGGISHGNDTAGSAKALTMSFSRIVGNTTSGGSGSNLNNNGATSTVINNWWGTNDPSGTINTINSGTTTFDPFVVLTHTASPGTIKINQSTTLTADMSKDSHGSGTALSGNLDEIAGLPVTFDGAVLGTIPEAQPETLNSGAQATATFNAGEAGGVGTANATVDQYVVAVNSNLIASATESGTTATITTVGAHGFSAGQFVQVSGVSVSGYDSGSNEFFKIGSTPSATTFTYTADTSGLDNATGGTVNGGIIILAPPSITKTFSPTTVAENTSSTLSFSMNNGNVIPIDTSFTDSLPTNLVVATTPAVVNSCGGTITANAGASSISYSNPSLAPGTCTVSVNVQSAVDNTYSNSVTIDSTAAGNGNTSTATLTVINPPHINKSFGATSVPLNGTTSLIFTLSSSNTNLTLNGVAFTDNLPAGLVVATPNGLSSTCSGTVSGATASSSVSLSGASLAPGGSCTVSVNVNGTATGVENNSVQVTSTNGGTGNTSNASLTVIGPPTITKVFGATSIPLNGNTGLSFTIHNPNPSNQLTGVGFTDPLPTGLIVSTPNGVTGSCGGAAMSAMPGGSAINLSGATLAGGASCTFSAGVTGTAAGQLTNTTSNVTSNEGGTGGTASAGITVVAPPSIAKSFGSSTIPLSGTTSLTFTLTNPAANTVAEAGVAFTDTLPAGLSVASGTSSVCGGSLTTAAPTGIALSGATIATNSQCQFSVTVTGAVSGQFTNTTGNVSSTNGGTGNTASASITVASPPQITKAFGASLIPFNGTTGLSFVLSNPNSTLVLTGVSFTDSLPAGLVIASPNALSSSCGGTATATAGSGTVSVTGGTLAAGGTCSVSANVQGTTLGVKNNSVQVTSNEGGTGNTSNANVTVVGPPVLSNAFGSPSIPLNGGTSLSFTIQNNNATASLSGLAFTDTLPAGLVVSTPNGFIGSCGSGSITAAAGTNLISLSGGTLAASGSCSFSVNVTGNGAGAKSNTTSTLASNEGGSGTAASASVTVVAPPSIVKAFSPSSISLNGTTLLTFTLGNPTANTVAEAGVAFTDTLPTGLVVATPSALTNGCGGTAAASSGGASIGLTGGSIGISASCTVMVNVTGTASGQYTNTTGAVSSTNGGTGTTASTNLTVASPPSITKTFGAASIPLNGTTTLNFNINNPNIGFSLSGVGFTDSLPAGLVIASIPNLSNSCGGTATASGGTVSLSGVTLSSGGCALSVSVEGTIAGIKNNSVTVGSTNAGTGNTGTASIIVVSPPTITKTFGATSIPLNGTTSLMFTVQNTNPTVGLTGVGFSDTLPPGLVISTPNGLSVSCSASTITATPGSGVISMSGGSLPAAGSCAFSVNVTGATFGPKNNITSTVTSNEGGTGGMASASVTVVAPPSIRKAFGATTVSVNGTTSLTLTITNPNSAAALTGVAVTDNFPSSLQVAATPSAIDSCGGALAAAAGSTTVSLSGGTIPSGASCSITLNVTALAPGNIVNTTGSVSSANGGTGNSGSASLQAGDFTISATPTSESVGAGQGATFNVTLSSSSGFQGVIGLNCVGGPANSQCKVAPSSVTLSSASKTAKVMVQVSTPPAASKGTFTLTITGESGNLTHNITVSLTIK